jgi:SpoVK/Ycf46/Vps4 family AAA+-type ATPase
MDNEAQANNLPYKFKEMRVYASTEWLADNKKKYRQVFDRHETAFVYAEVSLYNKNFDIDAWEVNIHLKCFCLTRNKKEICDINLKKNISKYDHTVYIREGWGNKKVGSFWTKGTYYWEAWIEKEKVATKYFYIEELDKGDKNDPNDNGYLSLNSVKLYEGKYDDISPNERKYYKVFSSEATRYIYADISFENLNLSSNWQCEIFVNFFNEARELKGQVIRLQQVKEESDQIRMTAGWGANVKGSWRPGIYTVEIVYMDRLIGVLPFKVDKDFVEGIAVLQHPFDTEAFIAEVDEDENLSFEEIMARLNSLVGLHHIKQKVSEHAQYLKFVQLRKDKGFKEDSDLSIHAVFTGNPGTGKTTVAKMMGKIYKKMGLLSRGHVHEVDRVNLVGEYIGQTAPKVKEAIEKAKGGILFIDEAYSLARSNDDSKDFGREVIEILVKEMSDGTGDFAVIVAGYPNEMRHFLQSNPGLKSRFKLYYEFQDYLPKELWEIVNYASRAMELAFESNAQELLNKIILRAYRQRDKTFGNARYVYDLVGRAKMNLGLRIMSTENPKDSSSEQLKLILLEDVAKLDVQITTSLPGIPLDEELLSSALQDLNSLIGLEEVKKDIMETVDLVRFYQLSGSNPLNKLFLHTIFIGNPGTGKTTIARILAKIYRALGILERGHIVETDRQGLVAGYVGQTAIKTAERIDEALGGVLFIDEAYSLTGAAGAFADYGHEAVQTILKRMEDDRGKFFVFAAGYPDNMEKFLKSNPGLRSRFDRILKFEDYTVDELYEIAVHMLKAESMVMTTKAANAAHDLIFNLHKIKDHYFGNARTVRQLINQIVKNQHLRLSAQIAGGERKHQSNRVIFEDVEKVDLLEQQKVFNRQRIGFGSR